MTAMNPMLTDVPQPAGGGRKKLWLALLLLGAVGAVGLVLLLGVGAGAVAGGCGGPP